MAIDHDNVPVKIPRAIPDSDAEIQLLEGGSERRAKRLAQRLEVVNLVNDSKVMVVLVLVKCQCHHPSR